MDRIGFSKRFGNFCSSVTLKKTEIAENLGITPQALQKYLNGERLPLPDMLEKIGMLGCNINWLINGEGEMLKSRISVSSKSKRIPVLAEVDCGTPVYTQINNDTVKYIEITDINYYVNPFVVIARGDSMRPYINPGDLLVCSDEPQKIKDGRAVIVNLKTIPEHYSSNAKLIRFLDDESVLLYSINTKHPPMIVKKSDIFRIYKVVRIIREVK
jgi:phage repressor protein C with HTH and peptisase S24 domain